jgi:hypothetical protein
VVLNTPGTQHRLGGGHQLDQFQSIPIAQQARFGKAMPLPTRYALVVGRWPCRPRRVIVGRAMA